MKTYEEQKQFFEDHWEEMKAALESGGPDGALRYIKGFESDLDRRVLFLFARQGMVHKDWQGKNLDSCITVAEAGMAECLRQAEAAEDDETRDKRVDAANIISYNLAADLAFCWEDGGLERNARHFNRGLKAAQDCIGWRVQLNKPPMPFSMAYWGRGIHHLALGDLRSALADFEESNSYAIKAAEAEGGPTAIDSGSGFSVLLGAGWVALAKVLLGETSAQEDYGRVIAAFTEQLESPDEHISGDAKIGLEQLEKIRNLLTGEQSREQSP